MPTQWFIISNTQTYTMSSITAHPTKRTKLNNTPDLPADVFDESFTKNSTVSNMKGVKHKLVDESIEEKLTPQKNAKRMKRLQAVDRRALPPKKKVKVTNQNKCPCGKKSRFNQYGKSWCCHRCKNKFCNFEKRTSEMRKADILCIEWYRN